MNVSEGCSVKSGNRPVLSELDRNWTGGPCRVCGDFASGRYLLYLAAEPPHEERIVGETYLHAGKDDCIHPPALSRALRGT